MRLIDADALVNQIQQEPTDGMYTEEILEIIGNEPTIEAAPVVHGRWVHCDGESNLWYCSECGERIRYNPSRRTYNIEKRPVQEVNKYCRGCGAKMDGDADG